MVWRAPTRRQLIVEAIQAGASTSDRIGELLGVAPKIIATELRFLESRRRVRRAGLLKQDRRGSLRQIWSV